MTLISKIYSKNIATKPPQKTAKQHESQKMRHTLKRFLHSL